MHGGVPGVCVRVLYTRYTQSVYTQTVSIRAIHTERLYANVQLASDGVRQQAERTVVPTHTV